MEEALIKRILPHSMEAEQSVIGSMIMSRDAIVEASEMITGADFYQQQYGIVFEAMVELHDEGKAVDLVTLQERLKERICRRKFPAWNLSGICWQQFPPQPM